MTTNEIRTKFLKFFESKGHRIMASDSLVPKDDPTVLFTTAGMQQFKPQFLGRLDGYSRAATCQKCLRTDDLDKVGKSDVHHTFFEMLGNFSFGDYFKKEAIVWAWEFLTIDLKLPTDKLWVSVYKDDTEAYNVWANNIKVLKNRIVKLGDKSNFWPSEAKEKGPNGPCGPCSEIFYDYGVNSECPKGKDCKPGCNCGRFSEVWNLVFTQFNRKDGGVLDPLPAKNIDTGMGLERLAAVVQGVRSNYETDNFKLVLKRINQNIQGISEQEARIIADHMRAIVFAIGDGIIPSNKKRGSVVKKLISTVADIELRNGGVGGIVLFSDLICIIIDSMGGVYPELKDNEGAILEFVRASVEDYEEIFNTQIPELERRIRDIAGPRNPGSLDNKIKELGKLFFFFKDTHGLSLATIRDTAISGGLSPASTEKALSVLEEEHMQEQRQRSRASSKMIGDVFADQNLDLNVPKTEFLGYSQTKSEAQVLKVISDGGRVRLILNRTAFYAEAGGQVGDTGFIYTNSARMWVQDTQKANDIYVHSGVMEQGVFKAGDKVQAVIDEPRRQAIKRNHTATHLLQAALREILGTHIKQQGSLVEESRLRFDFTHPAGVTFKEMQRIENRLNEFIRRADKVITEILPMQEAKKKGALAFFAEKYGDTVRMVSIGDYSRELCGGTHLSNTQEVQDIKITSEGSVAQGIRRVEVVTGKAAVDAFLQKKKQEQQLKTESQRLKEMQKQQQRTSFAQMKSLVDDMIQQAQNVKGVRVVSCCFSDADIAQLRRLSDLLKQKLPSGIFVLGTKGQQDATLIVSVTDDLVAKGIKANEIVNRLAPLFGASGGGRPQLAQAGSPHPDKLELALSQGKDVLAEIIRSGCGISPK